MHPLYSEVLSQQRRLEMLKQAEQERLMVVVRRPERLDRPFHRSWARQLGGTMVKWGQRLEQFGMASRSACSAASQQQR